MDSGNSSGSLQSSSGGDEEYDSRAKSSSISAFLNNPLPPPTHVGLGPFNTSTTTHMFDSLSNYLDPTQTSPSLLSLDMMWSKPTRSEPHPTDLGSFTPCSSSSSPLLQNQQTFLSTHQLPGQTRSTSASDFLTLPPQSGSRGLLSVSAATNNDQAHNTNTNEVRNPRKRSRASRRAPTTVLTTDTTNFRAMVQEFTGIPAPPFTSSSFPRTRLDLFPPPPPSARRSTTLLDPPYLLRPFAQRLQHHLHPFPPSSSTLLASNNSTNSTTNSTAINYQQLSDDHLGFLKQPLNFNMHNNPILTFQNILQAPPPKYPLANSSSVLASKTRQPYLDIPPPCNSDCHLKIGVLEELGLRHAHVNANVSGLHHQNNMVSSPSVGALSSGNNNLSTNASSTEWAQRTGTITNNDCDQGGGGGGGVMRPFSGTVNYSNVAERVTDGKVHYSSASSSDFRGEKGPECTVAAARNEGMVESWINCSSD